MKKSRFFLQIWQPQKITLGTLGTRIIILTAYLTLGQVWEGGGGGGGTWAVACYVPTRPYHIKKWNHTNIILGCLPPVGWLGKGNGKTPYLGMGAGYGSGFSRYKECSELTQDKNVADSTAVALEDSLAQGPVLVQCHLLVATISILGHLTNTFLN